MLLFWIAAHRVTIPIGRRPMRRRRVVASAVLAIGLAGLAGGCSSNNDNNGPRGSLAITMGATGAPAANAVETVTADPDDALANLTTAVITIAGIEARIAGGAWVPVDTGLPADVELFAIMNSGSGATLPADLLPAGDYDALALRITQLQLTPRNDADLVIAPPGRGWTVQIPMNFTVVAGESTDVKLKLRCRSSFRLLDGQFEFDPDIEVESVEHAD